MSDFVIDKPGLYKTRAGHEHAIVLFDRGSMGGNYPIVIVLGTCNELHPTTRTRDGRRYIGRDHADDLVEYLGPLLPVDAGFGVKDERNRSGQ